MLNSDRKVRVILFVGFLVIGIVVGVVVLMLSAKTSLVLGANHEVQRVNVADIQKLKITNIGNSPVENITLIVDNKYVLGAADPVEFLHYNIYKGTTPSDNITAIWRFGTENFTHYCSWGSPITKVRDKESALSRLYSYSFECCSDINPILEYFLALSGYETRRLWSPAHQALEV